ncbi:MAG: HD domain-containing protein [Burkholderiaceae bacterium]
MVVRCARDFADRRYRQAFGNDVSRLVASMRTLRRLQELTAEPSAGSARRTREQDARAETLRRMLLALSVDVRVVLLRLASRLQTLRSAAEHRAPPAERVARETLDLLAPLANRLGIAQIKWELEDLAFRFLEPDQYRAIARDLNETRRARQAAIDAAVIRLREALARNSRVYPSRAGPSTSTASTRRCRRRLWR